LQNIINYINYFGIIQRAQLILQMNSDRIDVKFLVKNGDQEFCQSHRPSRRSENHDDQGLDAARIPQEIMDAGYQEMRRDLSGELLKRIKSGSPLIL
jgi:restriction endonuclease Mrr